MFLLRFGQPLPKRKETRMIAIRRSLVLVVMTFVALSFLNGCSSKPSNSEIEEAVRSQAEYATFYWIREGKINTVEIKERGSFNKTVGYWPVKIRLAGTYNIGNNQFGQFDSIYEYIFYKDDYGKWQARMK